MWRERDELAKPVAYENVSDSGAQWGSLSTLAWLIATGGWNAVPAACTSVARILAYDVHYLHMLVIFIC